MVAFCNEIVDEIKRAECEKTLIEVISYSMTKFRRLRNSFNENGYIMNMIVTLRAVYPEEISVQARDNIQLAIAIFRQFQRQNPEGISNQFREGEPYMKDKETRSDCP